jgi:NADH-quinone oxidoreductase subunit J
MPGRTEEERGCSPLKLPMNTTGALFYLFSAVLLFASFRVITAKSTVHAALYLVLAFANAAVIWMLLKAEFLAIALVLVYVGAVMVLFLFVVMMLDVRGDEREGFWKHLPLAGLIGAVIALEMALVLMGGFRLTEAPALDPALVKMGNTRLLGIEVYTKYLYPLQVAAVVLLVAIVAAIALTLRRRKDSRYLDAGQQVKAKKADRLRIIKMSPVIEQPSAPPPAPAAPTGDKK